MVNEIVDSVCIKGSVGTYIDDQWVRVTSIGVW
jgi:hypothetical protein